MNLDPGTRTQRFRPFPIGRHPGGPGGLPSSPPGLSPGGSGGLPGHAPGLPPGGGYLGPPLPGNPPGTPPGGQPGAPPAVDLSGDPILQQIRAIAQRHIQQAQADELSGRKQSLIDYGYDQNLDALYPDEQTREAARQNPFSVLSNQQHNYDERTRSLEDALNKGNLFFSGYRGTQLGENAHGHQQEQAVSHGKLDEALGAFRRALLGVQNEEADNESRGLAEAFARYKPPDTSPAAPPTMPLPPAGGPGLPGSVPGFGHPPGLGHQPGPAFGPPPPGFGGGPRPPGRSLAPPRRYKPPLMPE